MNLQRIALVHTLVLALALLGAAPAVGAAERMLAGHEEGGNLAAAGITEIVTSPAPIIEETGADMRNFGAGGLITGPVVGSIKGAGQALRGGGRALIGILDVLTQPLRESPYHKHAPGSLR